MAYFSNGSEGMDYEARYCANCVHGGDCAVWEAHMLRNYDDCEDDSSILHLLIPRAKDGLGNEKCRMFVAGDSAWKVQEKRKSLSKTINPSYRDWASKKGLIDA